MENQDILTKPIKMVVDKYALLPEFLKVAGLVKEHIISFDHFINHEVTKTMKANDLIVCAKNPNFYLRYIKVYIEEDAISKEDAISEEDAISKEHTPHFCRLTDCTYDVPIKADVEYTKFNPKENDYEILLKTIDIGRMPVMLRSSICVLNGKDEAELAKLGECPIDPGGYFIIKGVEKVIFIQERLSSNQIIIVSDSKGRVKASVTSSTHETKSKTVLFMYKEKIYLQLNQFSCPIPIMIILKAMRMETDQEVVQMLGRNPIYGDCFYPSMLARNNRFRKSSKGFIHSHVPVIERDREELVCIAKLAKQAQRYDEMVDAMKKLLVIHVELTVEERYLLSYGYKKLIEAGRVSLQLISSIEHKEEAKGNAQNVKWIWEYRQEVELALSKICNDILFVIDEHLIPSASTVESLKFYYKIVQD